jgi:hypothetical protein
LHTIDDNDFSDIRALYQKIITQINLGIPILAINLKVCPVWGLITGYLKNKPGILCRTYFDESEEYSQAEHAPWLSFFIGEKTIPLTADEFLYNSLKIAIQIAKTEEFGEYKSGFNAFENWINELKKYSTKSKAFEEYEVNLTIFDYLIESRQTAKKYLTSMINKLKKGNVIVENYKKEVELLLNTRTNILPSYESTSKNWTTEIINHQIEILTQVLDIERETIELIENEI